MRGDIDMWYTHSMVGMCNPMLIGCRENYTRHGYKCYCMMSAEYTRGTLGSMTENDWPPKPGDTVWLDDDEQVTVVEFDDGSNWTGYASITYKYADGMLGGCTSEWFQTKSQRDEAAELNRDDDETKQHVFGDVDELFRHLED